MLMLVKTAAWIGLVGLACVSGLGAQRGGLAAGDVARYEAAVGALRAGEPRQAAAALQALARRYPGNFAVAESLGLAEASVGDRAAAERWLQRAAALRPDLALAQDNLGVAAIAAGHPTAAIAAFQAAVRAQPDDFDGWNNLGQTLAGTHALRAAAEAWERAWHLRPMPMVGYNLALVRHELGEDAAAAAVLEAAPAFASDATAQSLWGDVEEGRGRYEAAITHLQRAQALAPSEAHVFQLGLELLRHWTLPPARALLAAAWRDYPTSVRIGLALALTEYGAGDSDAALPLLARLLEQSPAQPGLLQFLGAVCAGTNARTAACGQLVGFAAAHPGNGAAAAFAAGVLIERGRGAPVTALAPAHLLVRRALAQAPGLAEAHLQAGQLAAAEGHWALAVRELETAHRLRPTDDQIEFHLAQAYARNGQAALARVALARHQAALTRAQHAFDARYAAIQAFVVQLK